MGQYWYPVNLDKKEFINPHGLNCGLKLWEIAFNTMPPRALVMLLAAMPEARGGGDLEREGEASKAIIGRWAGDRIALVGDYAQTGDLPPEYEADQIFQRCDDEYTADDGYTDITPLVRNAIEEQDPSGHFVMTNHSDMCFTWETK